MILITSIKKITVNAIFVDIMYTIIMYEVIIIPNYNSYYAIFYSLSFNGMSVMQLHMR